MSDWNSQRVEQLAPDPSALKAAQGVAKLTKWRTVGREDQLLWGECLGSGSSPYQVRIDLTDAASKCSCPSRKLPCKHALGLLLLLVNGAKIPGTQAPAFASEWHAARTQRAASRAAKQAAPETPPDPELQARRMAKRESRIEEGLALLDTNLRDLLDQGLATVRGKDEPFWSGLSARLTDCQAPGLARRVRQLADAANAPDWQEQLLIGFARLRLLIDAYRRLPHLPPALAAEVRTLVGWTQPQETLLTREGLRGHWQVLSCRQTQEDHLKVQRTWLSCKQEWALILDFAVGNQPLPRSFFPGQVLDAEVVYFEGVPPCRALVKQLHASLSPQARLPAAIDILTAQSRFGALLAINPWLERIPVVLGPVFPRMQEGRCQLVDAAGRVAQTPHRFRHGWPLVALAQGGLLEIFGEWDGQSFEPMAAAAGGRLYNLVQLRDMPVLAKVA